LAASHQPPEWLDEPSQTEEYVEINPPGRFAVHLFGHMHDELIRNYSIGGAAVQRVGQGRSLFGKEEHSFLRVLCASVFHFTGGRSLAIHAVDKAQTLSHLRLLNLRFGLLINFHEERLVDGVDRIVNGYGSQALKS
jgi:hypothetical protein